MQAVRDPSAETLVEYHKRVMQQAAAKWKDTCPGAKADASARARIHNKVKAKKVKETALVLHDSTAHLSMVRCAGADKLVDVMSCDTPWQLGNAAYPLANDLLGKVVDETKAFRNVYDMKWKERVGDIGMR